MTILSFSFGEEMWENFKLMGHSTNHFVRVENLCYKTKILYTNSPYIKEDELPLYFKPRELKKILKHLKVNESQRDNSKGCT